METEMIFMKTIFPASNTRGIKIGFISDDILIGPLLTLEDFLHIANNIKLSVKGYGKYVFYHHLNLDIKPSHADKLYESYVIYLSEDKEGLLWDKLENPPPVEFMLLRSNFIINIFKSSR